MKNTYKKIQAAMKANDKAVVAHAKKYGDVGSGLNSVSWLHAIERMVKAKKLRYSKIGRGYVAVK